MFFWSKMTAVWFSVAQQSMQTTDLHPFLKVTFYQFYHHLPRLLLLLYEQMYKTPLSATGHTSSVRLGHVVLRRLITIILHDPLFNIIKVTFHNNIQHGTYYRYYKLY